MTIEIRAGVELPARREDIELHTEDGLTLVGERLQEHLRARPEDTRRADPVLARRLRELLDSRVVEGVSLQEAAKLNSKDLAQYKRIIISSKGLETVIARVNGGKN